MEKESVTTENKGDDEHEMNGEKHGTESEEDVEEETKNELGTESEITVATTEMVQYSEPVSDVVMPEEKTETAVRAEKSEAAVSEASTAGDKEIPMDYRARRALRQKQKESTEKAVSSEGEIILLT